MMYLEPLYAIVIQTTATKITYVIVTFQMDYNAKFVMEKVDNVAVLQTMDNL